MLIPDYVYERLGFNDPYFHHSLGDLDYGMRANKAKIGIYQLGKAVGECDRHGYIMKWCNPEISLFQRWKALFHPTGYPPKEVFYFNKRHSGIVRAIVCVATTFFRCLMPKLWIKMNKANWI